MIRIVIAIVLAACTLSIAMAQPAKAGSKEDQRNKFAFAIEAECKKLRGNERADCLERTDGVFVPDVAPKAFPMDWRRSKSALQRFKRHYPEQLAAARESFKK